MNILDHCHGKMRTNDDKSVRGQLVKDDSLLVGIFLLNWKKETLKGQGHCQLCGIYLQHISKPPTYK